MSKNKYNEYLLSFLILLVFASCGKKRSDPVSAGPPVNTLKILSFILNGNPSDNSVYLEKVSVNGLEIALDIKMKNCKNVFGAAMEIIYDGSKIRYVFSDIGDLFGTNSKTVFYAELSKGQEGALIIGVFKEGNAAGADGDGTLVRVVFDAVNLDTNAIIEFNEANCSLKSSSLENPDIANISWIGGTLSYQQE